MTETSLWVGKEGIRFARQVNLYDHLMSEHPDDIIQEGDSIRLADNHSISIKNGCTGYQDLANEETGNSIELLTRHMGYGFQDAVTALPRPPAALPCRPSLILIPGRTTWLLRHINIISAQQSCSYQLFSN